MGLYLRVSSERQTAENQFDDLLFAEKDDSERNWTEIREVLFKCVYEERRSNRRRQPFQGCLPTPLSGLESMQVV